LGTREAFKRELKNGSQVSGHFVRGRKLLREDFVNAMLVWVCGAKECRWRLLERPDGDDDTTGIYTESEWNRKSEHTFIYFVV